MIEKDRERGRGKRDRRRRIALGTWLVRVRFVSGRDARVADDGRCAAEVVDADAVRKNDQPHPRAWRQA